MNKLLIGNEFSGKLSELCGNSTSTIFLFSAYIRSETLSWLVKHIPNHVSVKVVARWQKRDLLFGSSDLATYTICKENGWDFGIEKNLHGKLYIFDMSHFLIGSANLTGRGLGLFQHANLEFGIQSNLLEIDAENLESHIKNITWMNDELFEKISTELECSEISLDIEVDNWSPEIEADIEPVSDFIWFNDLLLNAPTDLLTIEVDDVSKSHDYNLLSVSMSTISGQQLKLTFKNTKIYSWIIKKIIEHDEINFGKLSYLIHNSLLDTDRHYRKDIKNLVAVLFEWMKIEESIFLITQHNKTVSVRLK